MKLLNSEKIRTLILGQKVELLPSPSSRIRLERNGPESSDVHNAVTNSTLNVGAVADPSKVRQLLALDIEELMRHTFRVQRERSNNPTVRMLD